MITLGKSYVIQEGEKKAGEKFSTVALFYVGKETEKARRIDSLHVTFINDKIAEYTNRENPHIVEGYWFAKSVSSLEDNIFSVNEKAKNARKVFEVNFPVETFLEDFEF